LVDIDEGRFYVLELGVGTDTKNLFQGVDSSLVTLSNQMFDLFLTTI